MDYSIENNNQDLNNINYWEVNNNNNNNNNNDNKNIYKKKKSVTFNDILTNMNINVNANGELQYMGPKINNDYNNYNDYNNLTNNYNNLTNNYNNLTNNYNNNINKKLQSLQPELKHSYIYNKYFKDYKDPNYQSNDLLKPKTLDEYREMLIKHKLELANIAKIKSKKLVFYDQNTRNININVSKNNLKKLNYY